MKYVLPTAESTEILRGRWPFLLAFLFALFPFGAGAHGAQEGSGLRQVVLVLLFVFATFAIARFPRRFHLIREGLPLTFVLLLIYVSASAAWSPEPWVSFKRVVQVIGITVLALGLLVGGDGRWRLHRLLPPTLLFAMLLAIGFSAAYPDFAFAENGLRGYMATKNNFGQFAALCLFVPLVLSQGSGKWGRLVWVGLALLGLAGLALSRSATAAMAALGVAVFYGVDFLVRRVHRSWWLPILSLSIVLLAVGFVIGLTLGFPDLVKAANWVLAPTGRDVTLSGRTHLWELMLAEAMKHPWFGLGYGGFWLGVEGASGQVAYLVKWGYPGQAHNGYLDLFNELGVVGCAFVLAFLVEHTRNLARLVRVDRQMGLFHSALLLLVVTLNLAEATLLRTTHPWWIVFVASVVEVSFLSSQGRAQAATSPTPYLGVAA
jgi:O-antigen ligase